eukprot:4165207-Prymnesium_polylepis.1
MASLVRRSSNEASQISTELAAIFGHGLGTSAAYFGRRFGHSGCHIWGAGLDLRLPSAHSSRRAAAYAIDVTAAAACRWRDGCGEA